MTTITEADVEQAALDWLSGLGWGVAHGPDIAPVDCRRMMALSHRSEVR